MSNNPFFVGQRVRVCANRSGLAPGFARFARIGDIFTVREIESDVQVKLDGPFEESRSGILAETWAKLGIHVDWFEPVERPARTIIEGGRITGATINVGQPGHRAPQVLIIDPAPEVTRPYDFEAGDQRFFGREEAIAQAHLRSKDRGCRQQVRPVPVEPGDEALVPRWLVQDI